MPLRKPLRRLRAGLLIAAALLLAACSETYSCGPCESGLTIDVVGIRSDPAAQWLTVCLDVNHACAQVRLLAYLPSTVKDGPYFHCVDVVSTHRIDCWANDDVVELRFLDLSPADAAGWPVDVTATEGRSPDIHASGVFVYRPTESLPCACNDSSGVVNLASLRRPLGLTE